MQRAVLRQHAHRRCAPCRLRSSPPSRCSATGFTLTLATTIDRAGLVESLAAIELPRANSSSMWKRSASISAGAGVVEALELRLLLVLVRDFVGERAFHIRRGDRVFDQRGLGALRELLPRRLVELAGLGQARSSSGTRAAHSRNCRCARPSIAPGEKPARSSSTCAFTFAACGGLGRRLELGRVHVLHGERARRRDGRRKAERRSRQLEGIVSGARAFPLPLAASPHQRRAPARVPAGPRARIVSLPARKTEGQGDPRMPLSEEQNLMRASCRAFVDDTVIPFIRQNWQREWEMNAGRPAARIDPRRRGQDRHPHARRAGGIRRRRARAGQRGADLRADRRGDRARRFRPCRQAGAELEGRGAAAQPRAAPPAGEMVQAPRRGPAIPARALPDRAARRLRPLAALQRAGSRDADARREGRQRLGDQRPQAVHLERLRRRPLRRLRQHQSQGRHAAGHVELPGAARHARASPSRAATRRSAAAS